MKARLVPGAPSWSYEVAPKEHEAFPPPSVLGAALLGHLPLEGQRAALELQGLPPSVLGAALLGHLPLEGQRAALELQGLPPSVLGAALLGHLPLEGKEVLVLSWK